MDLASVINLIGGAVGTIGVVVLGAGLLNLGMTIKDGMQGGGGQLNGAIAMIIGGGVIIAAGILIGQVDVTWMPSK